jgi:hypothetical protein
MGSIQGHTRSRGVIVRTDKRIAYCIPFAVPETAALTAFCVRPVHHQRDNDNALVPGFAVASRSGVSVAVAHQVAAS